MKQKTAIIVISYFCAALAALSAFSAQQFHRAEQFRRLHNAGSQHAFAELVTSMTEIDSALKKSLYATSPAMASAVCTELFGKAMTAQMSLGVLPFSTQELEQTAGFISRVGDYAFYLSRAAAQGEGYDEAVRENIRALSDTAALLAQDLTQLQTDMSDGYLTMDELVEAEQMLDSEETQDTQASQPVTLGGSMRLIEQEFPEIPSLVYDGPFSSHIADITPKLLENQPRISQEEGLRAAAEFLELEEEKLTCTGEGEGQIPVYYYSAKIQGGELEVEVCAQGGHVLSLLSSRPAGNSTMEAEDALRIAKRFLERQGYTDMQESYYIIQNNVLTANFAWTQENVICYPDLVKVAVALDSGMVCGFEAMGYLSSHCQRELPPVEVDRESALQLVTEDLTVLAHQLALIPTEGRSEKLCHEFKCETPEGQHYLIYVDAVSGQQEKILILLEDENGTLAL